VDVVAGDFQKAHLAGVERSKKNYAFHLDEPADVTITSAYPYLEAPQTLKPVIPASLLATRSGGSVIVMAASRGRLSEPMLAAFDKVYSGNSKHETGSFFSPALIYIPACAARNSITMVSSDLDAGSVARLGFRHASCLEEAIERERRIRPQATVNILPAGGLVLPLAKAPAIYEQV
jgi:nickel-dependent lactate racemase